MERMAEREPVSVQPLSAEDVRPPTWREAQVRLEDAQFYWLATTRPDGRPHLMTVLAVWLDGSLDFSAAASWGKRCILPHGNDSTRAVNSDDLHLVVEGTAEKVSNTA